MWRKRLSFKILSVNVALLSVLLLSGCPPEPEQEPFEPPPEAEVPAEPSGEVVDGVRVVQVRARQFEFEPEAIVVNEGEDVRLEVTSEDVMHGIGIEAYDINEEVPPDETRTVEFRADEAGTYEFLCSVYCGPGHEAMRGQIVVLEADQTD